MSLYGLLCTIHSLINDSVLHDPIQRLRQLNAS